MAFAKDSRGWSLNAIPLKINLSKKIPQFRIVKRVANLNAIHIIIIKT